MVSRAVNKVEQSVLSYQLSSMVEFKLSKELASNKVKEALLLVKKKYPYLRMKIVRDSQLGYIYVEQSEDELSDFIVDFIDVRDPKEFDDWQKQLNIFGYKLIDLEKSVFGVEVRRFQDRYRLYFGLNHTGVDTKGEFCVLKDILGYLDGIIEDQRPEKIESLPFLNVQDQVNRLYDLEEIRKEGVYKSRYHEKFLRLEHQENDPIVHELFKNSNANGKLNADFFDLDPESSRLLLINCKTNKATIQGVLSVIGLLCAMHETGEESTLGTRVSLLNNCLCDMRFYFDLKTEDLIKSASDIYWLQTLSESDNIWEAAANASRSIHALRDSFDGFKDWFRVINGLPMTFLTFLVSTIGVVDINQEKLRNILVQDLRFSMSRPQTNVKETEADYAFSASYLYCFTFNGHLRFLNSFSYPNLSQSWARNFSRNFKSVLEMFAKNSGRFFVKDVLSSLKKFKNLEHE